VSSKQLPEWLRQLAEGQAMAGDWPNGEYPHDAFTARGIVKEATDSYDAQVCLLQVVIDEVEQRQVIIDDLLKACKRTANICEAVGHCVGEWTAEHQSLAQEYAARARAAIAKAEGEEVTP